ncbi:MAG: hypothetical protein OZ921_11895 [Sorangiineae bacterium]|nr:hypothetical protein [Polyangiaceae bacterium]MEB2323207.1 hypothetical protein [Sorangiineae bacterium]
MKLRISLTALAALGLAATLGGRAAEAEVAVTSAGRCTLRGQPALPPDLEIFSESQGGEAIARFTGAAIAVSVRDFPASGKGGRASVQTGNARGAGSFRIDGFVDAAKVPLATARDVPVVLEHLWLGAHRRVHFVAAAPDRLRVELTMTTPMRQSFSAWASCGALSLDAGVPVGWTPAGRERGYVVKKDRIDLYDRPSAERKVVTTLIRSAESGILLFGTERRGGFVRVAFHGPVIIDAWARLSDLVALPPGETMDQVQESTTVSSGPRLALAASPRLVRTTREVALRVVAKHDARVIGKIDPETDTYVIDVVAGWASVMPKALDVAPAGEKQFWAKASELGLGT